MSCISEIFKNSAEFMRLCSAEGARGAVGISDSVKPAMIHSLSLCCKGRAFVITPDEASAARLTQDLSAFGQEAVLLPNRELNFDNIEGASREFEHIRLGALARISGSRAGVAVCSAASACLFTMPPQELKKRTLVITEGSEMGLEELERALVFAGYSRYEQVEGPAQFAVRGGIADVFPPGSVNPVRLEFWGNTVDSMYYFDPVSQRRVSKAKSARLIPCFEVLFDPAEKFAEKIESLAASLRGRQIAAREWLLEDANALRAGGAPAGRDKYLPLAYSSKGVFDYMEPGDLLIVCESAKVKENMRAAGEFWKMQISGALRDYRLCRSLDRFSLDFTELTGEYAERGAVYLDSLARGSFDTPVSVLADMRTQSFGKWSGRVSELEEELRPLLKAGNTVCVMAGTERSARALWQDLENDGIRAVFSPSLPQSFTSGAVNVTTGSAGGGFRIADMRFALFTHSRFSQKPASKKRARMKNAVRSLDELSPGDYVVHAVHGIGVFCGIQALEINKVKKDYIKISYAKGDALYVPVTQLDLVSKYTAPGDGGSVKINRLGGTEWKKTKQRVRESVKDMAKELIALYAKRMSTKGYAFSPDSDLQRDFELRFAYDETEDQLRCADEIKHDMERPVPMERLLCGDVGFGKTEVALRAAFKCVSEGKQCAVLVPTTVLAMQHFNTARERMQPYPITVEMLSRFVGRDRQKEIIKGVASGEVELLIGTHRMISKDIRFKDLGLLIIDEEQRFGVAQKEKLKKRFPRVDVLTLSATPIPRTLNMAMSGIRDMSVLEEAPADRLPVQTYVMEYDFDILREAMERELDRGGQCYYLHNNIETIDGVAARIARALPQARVAVAHGQMTQEQLSDIWASVVNGETDILVCTTIIETGVDVANVNTLIIENADRMGLAQLHQIRGRVGRSSRRAFAYLTFMRDRQMSETAQKRLEAIREYTEFGSGFKIAMRDLEIRGAGDLLGGRQHGHMQAVGYDMYLKLLADAVAEQKGELRQEDEERECLIDLPVEAHIPEGYIDSTPQRLSMYKRIAAVRTDADANDVLDELRDRFGDPPASITGLLQIALLRNSAVAAGVYEITQRSSAVLLYMSAPDVRYATELNKKFKGRVMLSAAKKPYIAVKPEDTDVLGTVKAALEIMIAVREKIEGENEGGAQGENA